ncbi:MAG: DNA translocase FtsK [Candidatus Coproplasma sp.]
MDIKRLEKFIKGRDGVTVPEVQIKFSLGYKEARRLFAELEEAGAVELKENLTFVSCKKKTDENTSSDDKTFRGSASDRRERLAQLEQRRQELLRRMRAAAGYKEDEEDEEDEDEDEDEEDEDEDEDEDDDEEENVIDYKLCLRVLNFCVDYKRVAPSLIQRKFNTGFMEACKIIDWMRSKDYITQSDGIGGDKVLLSREQFDRLYGGLDFSEEGEEEKRELPDAGELIAVIKAVRDKKLQPISADKKPDCSLWENKEEFMHALKERFNAIVIANEELGEAIREAEIRLDGVRDTHDRAMVQLYERVVYELKNLTPGMYFVIHKKTCGD